MKVLKPLLISMLSVLLLAGCSTKAPGSSDSDKSSAGDKDKQIKIGLSLSTQNNPFFVSVKEGVEKAAKEEGAKLYTADAQDDSAKQSNDIQDLIEKGVDVLLINPTDSDAIASSVKSANSENIPVITVDRSASGGKVASHVASDNVKGGEMAAKFLLKKLNNKGNIVELEGIPGSSAARERGEGFHKVIDKQKGIKLVAKQPADFNRSKGLSVLENIVQGHKNIDAVFSQNDEMALGAIQALKSAGLKDVLVTGFDGTDDGLKAVKDGSMTATIAQQPVLIGQKAVETAVKVVNGKDVKKTIPVALELKTGK